MSVQYREMWQGLGLDLEAHDALLGALGQAYGDVFLSQANRPASIDYFNFVMSEVHGLRVQELMDAKARGRKVIGSFCAFVPEELVLAVDGISVGLCAGAEFRSDLAEEYVPASTCALIKSAFGFKLGKVCPYQEASDLIVGENTCDGKKKSYEEFSKLVPNFHVMDLPQMKSAAGRALLAAEYQKFARLLEDLSGRTITGEDLKNGIRVVNAKRRAMARMNALRACDPAPISGLDALLANQLFFFDDPVRFTDAVNKVCDELEERIKRREGSFPPGHPRLIVSGCPMAIPNWKPAAVIESSGAVIVGEESCVGERGSRWLTDEDGETVERLLENVTDRYFNIDCAVFTPNPSRLEHLLAMVKKYRADGVIHYSLKFCQPYQMESGPVERALQQAGVPALRLETDYSAEDAPQLQTRVEAFVEMLKSGGGGRPGPDNVI